ncbi:MAG TPA: hypothetical protein DCM87_12035 [Planctomycetes bacterium]|nr:hypothetical protein [Planctomycetota bacterium]
MTDDWRRVRAALGGDRQALEDLVREHLRPTYAVAYALTGSSAEAEEIVQETFARALEGLSGFRRNGRFGAWLVGIVRHLAADRQRDIARRKRALESWARERTMAAHPCAQEQALEREEALALIVRSLERLPEDLRVPLVLHYVEDLSAKKVAERLDLEPAAVRKRLQRARERIGEEMATTFGAAVAFLRPSAELEASVLAHASRAASAAGASTPAAPVRTWGALRLALPAAGSVVAAVLGALWLASLSPRKDSVPPVGGLEGGPARTVATAPAPPAPAEATTAIAPEERVSVRGRIVDDATSRPIPGARVSFLDDVQSGSGATVGEARSDESGRFRFDGPVPARVRRLHFRADRDGYASQVWWSAFNPRLGGPDCFTAVIRLTPALPVDGVVLLEGGEPATTGTVRGFHGLREETDRYTGRFVYEAAFPIDSRGRFRIWLAGDRAALLAMVPGYVPAFSAPFAPADAGGPIVVRLERGARVEGRILGPMGRPVAGCQVVASFTPRTAEARFGRNFRRGWRACTDEHGRFRIDGLQDFVTLRVTHDDFEAASFDVAPAAGDVTLRLAFARWLTFEPVLDEGTIPDAGARPGVLAAELRHPGHGASGKFAYFFRSGPNLRSDPIRRELTRALLVVPGFLPVDVSWPAGTGPHALGKILLRRGFSLEVRVVDAATRAVSDARVALKWEAPGGEDRSATDESGTCRFDGMAPGGYQLVVDCPGFLPLEERVVLVAPRAARTVRLDRGAALAARILGPGGEPLAGATLSAFDARIDEEIRMGVQVSSPAPWVTGKSDESGMVRLTGIPPMFALWLVCHSTGFVPAGLHVDPIGADGALDLEPIVLESGASLRIRVHDERGAPIPWASVVVSEDVRSRWWTSVYRTAECDASGAARVSGLPAGVYTVSATSVDRTQADSIAVELDGRSPRELEVELALAVTYGGTVAYADDGERLQHGTVWLDYPGIPGLADYTADILDGTFSFKELPRGGPVGVHVLYGEGMHEITEPRSAEELPEWISVARGATLAIRATVEGGAEPPRHIQCTLTYEGSSRAVQSSCARDDGFSIEDLPPGRARLGVDAGGYQASPETQEVELSLGKLSVAAVSLTRNPPSRLTVALTGPLGGPVADASLLLHDGGSAREVARSGSDGTATLEWTGALWGTLIVEAPGLALARVPRPAEAAVDGRLSLSMAPEAVVIAEVLDSDGKPADVGSAGIELKEHIGIGGGIYRSARIRSGVARLDALPAGEYVLYFGVDNLSWGTMETCLAAGEVREVHFRIPPPLDLRGQVLHNGRSVAGGGISFRGHGASPTAQIGATGGYRMRLFARGKYTAWVSCADEHGEFDQMVEIEVQDCETLDIEVRTVTFRGRVVDRAGGAPVAGAGIQVSTSGELSNGVVGTDGAFFLPHVRPGTYQWLISRYEDRRGTEFLGKGEIALEEDTTATLEVDVP